MGKSVATAFAEAGADLALVDIDLEETQKAAEEIKKATGVKLIAVKADAAGKDDVDVMIQAMLDTYGRIDAAVCNAGIGVDVPTEEITLGGVAESHQYRSDMCIPYGTGSGKSDDQKME